MQFAMVLAALAAAGASVPQQTAPGDAPRLLFLTATATTAGSATLQFFDSGAGAVAVAWPTDAIAWYFLRSEGYQENHDRLAPAKAGDTSVTVTPATTGVTMVGVDFQQSIATQPAGEVRAWLRDEGFDAAAESLANLADERPLRVRWRVSAKALVRAAAEAQPAPSEIAMSKSGQQAEIRLWADATLAAPGDDVPLKLYADGDKLASVDVRVWLNGAALPPLAADGAGVVNLTTAAGGTWRFATAGVRVLKDDAAADVEVFVATLTYENAAKGGAR